MGNTHDTEIARIEADYIHTRWRTIEDYRWGYTNERGKSVRLSVRLSVGGRGRRGVHRRTAGFIDERGSSTNPASRRTRRRPRTPPTCIIRSLREIEATGNTRPRRQGTCFFYPLSIRGESSPRNCIVGVEVTEAGGNAVSPVAVRLSDEVLLRLAHCL